MNKRALIGKIIFLAALAIFVIGATVYYAGDLKFRKGDITATIAYDPQEESKDGIEIIELPPEIEPEESAPEPEPPPAEEPTPEEPPEEPPEENPNETDGDLTLGDNNPLNYTNISE